MEFHLSDILSITTGRLVSREGMAGVYKILNYMTNSELWTHQLPDAAELCRPYLFDQYPDLKFVEWKQDDIDIHCWVGSLISTFGEFLSIESIPVDDHLTTNPFRGLEDFEGKVIQIDV